MYGSDRELVRTKILESAEFCYTWVIHVHFPLTTKNPWLTIFAVVFFLTN